MKKTMKKFQHKNNEPIGDMLFPDFNSEVITRPITKEILKQNEIISASFLSNLCMSEIFKLHDKIITNDIIDSKQRSQVDAYIFGAKSKPQELINTKTGSRNDPKPYFNYSNTKIETIFGSR